MTLAEFIETIIGDVDLEEFEEHVYQSDIQLIITNPEINKRITICIENLEEIQ